MEGALSHLMTDKQARYLSTTDADLNTSGGNERHPLESYEHEVLEEGTTITNKTLNLNMNSFYNESDIDGVLGFYGDSFERDFPKKTPKMLDSNVIKDFNKKKKHAARMEKKCQAIRENQAARRARQWAKLDSGTGGKTKSPKSKAPVRKRCSYPPDVESFPYTNLLGPRRRTAPAKLQPRPQYNHYPMQYTGMASPQPAVRPHYLPPNMMTSHRPTYTSPLHHYNHLTGVITPPKPPSPQIVLPDIPFDPDQFLAEPSPSTSTITIDDETEDSPKSRFSSIIDNILDDSPDKLIDLEFAQLQGDDSLQFDPYFESLEDSYFEIDSSKRPRMDYTDFIVDIEDLNEPLKEFCDVVENNDITHTGS